MPAAIHQTIVVTGASSGIGRELALQLASPGSELWLVGRNLERLEQVAGLVRLEGAIPRIAVIDLNDLGGCEQFLSETFPSDKKVDAIYLAAGITMFGEVRNILAADWDQIYKTNFLSPAQWAHFFYSKMVSEKCGTIVVVSSLAAYAGYPTATPYATMKAGLIGLFRSLWYEGKPHGVMIHLASPGYVDSRIYRSATYRETSYGETMQQIEALGFGAISSEAAAREIIRSVGRGKKEFAFPAYAAVMKWVAPRVPYLIDLVHLKIMKHFRQPL